MTDLVPGELYHVDDIQSAFCTALGWYIKGITPRISPDGSPYVLIFSSFLNPEGSWIEGSRLYVRGEGKCGDQLPQGANGALLQSEQDGRPLYGFRKEARGKVWMYLGRLSPLGHSVDQTAHGAKYLFSYEIDSSLSGTNNIL